MHTIILNKALSGGVIDSCFSFIEKTEGLIE